jgi:hypothetical protein
MFKKYSESMTLLKNEKNQTTIMIKNAIITKSNLNSIISSLDEIGQIDSIDNNTIYKWPVYFLSPIELKKITRQREFLKDPENILKVYKKRVTVDSKQFIFEGAKPSYHTYSDCQNLKSKYNNYEIPQEIKDRGDDEIYKFRTWFKQNQNYLEEKPDLFIFKLKIAFNLGVLPSAVVYDNSGITEIDNLNLNDLESRIDNILKLAGSFYTDNPDKQTILKRFQKYTFLAYSKNPIKNNDTQLSDDELKSLLFEYDMKFKKPFKELLLQYYMVKFNPELKFNGLLLEQLGFKICQNCLNLDNKKLI